MQFFSLLSAALALNAWCGQCRVINTTATVTANNGIRLVSGEALFTFEYSTQNSNSRNWIGLYHASGGGPDNQELDAPSLSWSYAPLDHGKVKVSASGLAPGDYKAYFLADDNYRWVADPIIVTLSSAGGQLTLVAGDIHPYVFGFSTSSPSSRNWIGIWYANGGAPVNEARVSSPATWEYTGDASSGSIRLKTRGLPPGRYVAYYLHNDGFTWLANPINFYIRGSPGAVSFLVDSFTTHLAKQGVPFVADISGLLANAPDGDTRFRKLSSTNGDWIDVSDPGLVSGTPPAGADGSSTVTVEATGSNGSKATLQVYIPIQQTIGELVVLSFNIWIGGIRVNDSHKKQLRHIIASGADMVGMQESNPAHGHRLAQALGWYASQGKDASIISRYPITETYAASDISVAVQASLHYDDAKVVFWNAHPGYNPYGPYDFCFSGMSVDQVLDREAQSGRTSQIRDVVSRMSNAINDADNIPVLLTGDFNAPSHLD